MFTVNGQVFVPLCLNCGLSAAPWFFTKAISPVVAHLRSLGHRVFAYLDDFFGSPRPISPTHPAGPAETTALGKTMSSLFRRLGLELHPTSKTSPAAAT